MMSETKKPVDDTSMNELIQVNKLMYTVPPSLSLFNTRQYIKYPAQNQTYQPSSTVIVPLSNSDVFVDGRNSYVTFDIKNTGVADFTVGKGSFANVFNRARYIHASGVEITHALNVNEFVATHDKLSEESEFWRGQGQLMGYPAEGKDNTLAAGATTSVALPLHKVITMFDSHGDKLTPPFLLSGSRLELQLETGVRAFVGAGAQNYEISNVEVVLDSYILSDAAFSVMEKMSAAGLIEYTYQEYEIIEGASAVNSINMEMTKSIGRATAAYGVVTGDAQETDVAQDLFANIDAAQITQYQWRVNSLYLPALPATGVQKYMSVLAHHKTLGRYSYTDFQDQAIIAQTLQRSEFLGPSSGLPINSSSSLRLNVKFDSSAGRRVKMMVPFLKIVTPFLYDRVLISV